MPMEPYLYHLHAAKGSWPDDMTDDVLNVRIVASTIEKARAEAERLLGTAYANLDYDHAWLKNDDGFTIWASADESYWQVDPVRYPLR